MLSCPCNTSVELKRLCTVVKFILRHTTECLCWKLDLANSCIYDWKIGICASKPLAGCVFPKRGKNFPEINILKNILQDSWYANFFSVGRTIIHTVFGGQHEHLSLLCCLRANICTDGFLAELKQEVALDICIWLENLSRHIMTCKKRLY